MNQQWAQVVGPLLADLTQMWNPEILRVIAAAPSVRTPTQLFHSSHKSSKNSFTFWKLASPVVRPDKVQPIQ